MWKLNKIYDESKRNLLDSAPDIWNKVKESIARKNAEDLISELNGVPSNCGKLVFEQVSEIPVIRRVA